MHDAVFNPMKWWIDSRRPEIDTALCADVGGRNVNGSVKDVLPNAVAFDICSGKGIDIVIHQGIIPEEHKGKYKYVFSISTLPFAPSVDKFVKEIIDLCAPGAEIFLSCCSTECPYGHDSRNYSLYQKFTVDSLKAAFEKDFDVKITNLGADLVLEGRLLDGAQQDLGN